MRDQTDSRLILYKEINAKIIQIFSNLVATHVMGNGSY